MDNYRKTTTISKETKDKIKSVEATSEKSAAKESNLLSPATESHAFVAEETDERDQRKQKKAE